MELICSKCLYPISIIFIFCLFCLAIRSLTGETAHLSPFFVYYYFLFTIAFFVVSASKSKSKDKKFRFMPLQTNIFCLPVYLNSSFDPETLSTQQS